MAPSAYRDAYAATDNDRPSTSGSESKKELWSILLDNVSSGKKIPEKKLIILGGTSSTQADFLDSLQQDSPNRIRPPDRSRPRKIPVANRFALGYTYQDVYDSDHEDIVARLSAYTLSSPSPAYAPLLARLLTPSAIPNTAVAILLDWAKPWTFVRTLRSWIRLLNTVSHSLPVESKYALEENTTAWQHARDAALASSMPDAHTSIPLGPGEYDDPLGLPLVVVCQNALAVESLEKERGYRESHFDYILQFLRTVLLKHGAALIYTMPEQPGQLKPLIHSVLGIQAAGIAVTGKEKSERTLKHNVVDRERVLVPPAWDSWGKIRVLREGFDVEGISRAWGVEIQDLPSPKTTSGAVQPISTPAPTTAQNGRNREDEEVLTNEDAVPGATNPDDEEVESIPDQDDDYKNNDDEGPATTAALYELQIQDPHPPSTARPKIDVPCTLDQQFFSAQLERLEAYRAEDEAAKKAAATTAGARRPAAGEEAAPLAGRGGSAMAEHIGPVQMNVGGIQYDADEVLRRLKERNPAISTSTTSTPAASSPFPTAATNTIMSSNGNSGGGAAGVSTPTRAARAGTATSRDSTPFTPISSPPNAMDSSGNIPTENLEAYFASLMKKGQRGGGGSSTTNSPRPLGGREA